MTTADLGELKLPPILRQAVERLDDWCRANASQEESQNQIEGPLYHYTSAAGLKGIVASQSLWFTDYRHLNDPTELKFGVDQAHQALLEAQQGADPRVGLFHRMAIDLFSHENLENLGFFVGSFTRARDDLGQWITYADNGRGFAIGYAPQMFEIVEGVKAVLEENAFLGPVVYDPVGSLARHRAAIDAAAAIFLETAEANAELLRDKAVGVPFMRIFSLRLIASALIWNALTTKHPGYKREQEVRLVVMGPASALEPAVQTRQRNDKAVPFVAHPWPACGPGQIAEVLIGPATPEVDERAIRQFLADHGVTDVSLIRSDIPYRP